MEWIKINDEGEIEFVSEEVKLVPEIQALKTLAYNKGPGDHDGRKKLRAKTELKYLYLVYSPKSPYKDYSEVDRVAEAKLDCKLPDSWEESTELKLLIPKFKKGNSSKVERLLATVTKFLDKFEIHLNTIDLTERTATGGLLYDPKKILETLNQLPKVAATVQELEQQVKYGLISTTKVQGDHELGWAGVNKNALQRRNTSEDEETNE